VGNTTASLEGASNQDVRKAQVFSERLKNMVSRDAYIALAKSDPEGARAFARQKASDEAFNSMYGLLVDPQNELAFRRMKASGELKARVDLEKAQAVAAGRQLDIMQSELDLNRDTLELNKVIKPAEIDARIAEARAKTEEAAAALAAAKNGPALAAAQLGIAQADLARARLMADAAQFSQKYAPVKDANGTYIKATQDYEDFVQAAMTRGGGKMPMDANTVAQLNVLTNHVNASIKQLNAVGQDSLKETWSMISEWPPSKMVEGNFIWRVSGGLVGKAPQIVQDIQTPAAAKAAEKSSPAPKPAGGKTADDVANDFVNRQ
jgi:hypothetical protein